MLSFLPVQRALFSGIAIMGSPPIPTVTTWNPADKTGMTLSNGDLTATRTAGFAAVRANLSKSAGKLHFEITLTTSSGSGAYLGISQGGGPAGGDVNADATWIVSNSGGIVADGASSVGTGDTFGAGDVLAFEYDFATAQLWIEKLGGTGRKGPYASGLTGALFPFFSSSQNNAATLNAGATAFAITPSATFSAWG